MFYAVLILFMDAYLFWKNIDVARKGKRPLKDVCKQFGITYQRIADQRSECRFPKLEDAYFLALSYNVSLEFLLTGEKEDLYFSNRTLAIAKACEQAKDGILESIEKLLDIDPKKRDQL